MDSLEFAGNAPVKRLRVGYLLTGSLGLFFIGIIFAWSIVKVPLRDELGFSSQQLAQVYSTSICFFCLGNIVTGLTLKKLGVKKLLLTAAGLIFLGFLGTCGLTELRQLRLLLCYGVCVGGGVGLAYNSFLSTVNAWFPDKKGTSSGVLMMCFGLSSVMWGKLGPLLFSDSAIGRRRAYLIFGAAIALVLLLCAGHIRPPKAGEKLPAALIKSRRAEDFSPLEIGGAQVLRRRSFWIYYIYGICAAAVGSTVLSFSMDVCVSLGAGAALAASMAGIASVGNGLGRILCGLSFDSFGRNKTLFLANCATVLAPLLMLSALKSGSLLMAGASLLFSGLSFGTCPTIGSALMSSFYGMKHFPINYALSNSKMVFSSVSATAASFLLARSGGYTAPYIMLLSLALTAFSMSFMIKRP